MGILVVVLVAAWGLVLGPALLQSMGTSPMDTEQMFRRSLRALGRRPRYSALGGRSILVPAKVPYPLQPVPAGMTRSGAHSSTAAERRRRNLARLAIFVIASFALAWVPGLRFLLVVNLIADVLLILYLGAAVFLVVWPPRSEVEHVEELEPEPQRVEGL